MKFKWDIETFFINMLGVIAIIALVIGIGNMIGIDKLENTMPKNATLNELLADDGFEFRCIKHSKELVTRFNVTCSFYSWDYDEIINYRINDKLECNDYETLIDHHAIEVEIDKDCIQWGIFEKIIEEEYTGFIRRW